MKTYIVLGSGITLGLVVAHGCAIKGVDPLHCAVNDGDHYCAVQFDDGSRPYCQRGTDECYTADSQYGCVEERPVDACYSPCGGRSTIAENGECVMEEESSSSGSSSGGTETEESSSSESSSSTTGPMPCMSDEQCTDADAPFCGTTGECGTCDAAATPDAACAGLDPGLPLCVGGACVACTPENPLVCDEQLLLCDGMSNTCVSCQAHAECESGACELAVGRCFAPDVVVHVDGDGGQDFMNVAMAVGSIEDGMRGVIVVHAQDSGLGYPGTTIDAGKVIALLAAPGEAPILQGTGGNPGLQVEGAGTAVYMDGLEVSLAAMSAVGLRVNGALAWVDRSRIVQNSGGGIVAENNAELTLRNCFVGGNGSGLAGSFGIDVSNANVRVLYTTVARNDEETIDSIRCTAATVDVRNSIVVGRDADSIECPGIVITNSALDEDIGGNMNVGAAVPAWFINSVSDFHLTPMGAAVFADIARWTTGDPPTDIDGEPRPTEDATPDFAGADVP